MSTTAIRARDEDEEPTREAKKARTDAADTPVEGLEGQAKQASNKTYQLDNLLPPSHVLLNLPRSESHSGASPIIREEDVGISEYISSAVPPIEGIIKQRFTDFLVFEVDQEDNVVHLKSLGLPESSDKPKDTTAKPASEAAPEPTSEATEVDSDPHSAEQPKTNEAVDQAEATDEEPWPARFSTRLEPLLSERALLELKEMFLQGPNPPQIKSEQPSGWNGSGQSASVGDLDQTPGDGVNVPEESSSKSDRNAKRGRGGRGRGGRGGGRERKSKAAEDNRKVITDPIPSKATRTALHTAIRELMGGKLDTATNSSDSKTSAEGGSQIIIKWASQKQGSTRGGQRGSSDWKPPFIHFSLQKTNRDTQDALAYLSRTLHVSTKDLSVAGTKDKRGVTTQRVALRRGAKTLEDIWKMANGFGRLKTMEQILSERGDRGIRIGDLVYRRAGLELGMLKGNAFVITLRNVKADSDETLEKAMNSMKTGGFINYYGMQRFGTAAIPTHAIGLALLRSDWAGAVSLILRPRPGEYADAEAARRAWLEDRDLDKALRLMPRRVVAERCILESYQKQGGEDRNAMGALSTIPRNLRLMYVHAYQSYVWNAIVSERIKKHGSTSPIVGDLVYEKDIQEPEVVDLDGDIDIPADAESKEVEETLPTSEDVVEETVSSRKSRKPWTAPKVKELTADDLPHYSIFDVIMPLPGNDVAYPGGELGERYREFLRLDGLDPNNFVRKQKEYTLGGSYRNILHLPKNVSWKVLRYNDPDVSLAQADEDKILGFDAPLDEADGRFMALQIELTLGTAAYATMALREVTKTDTGSQHQSALTQSSDDQKYRLSATT
ncbi:tRNA pseudouridine synthase D [Sistotremastrum suecicum HHB10207 ss-3]|uniref:tRNA pseudouridine synthase D n=1 Tax=Sistotremastrum suecicum HHB10207 ss-3 TaxID=1314776 RepID=A0A166G075_9AGAM|nr:tRNA pseudouridine synthase D [Sistotremastrum suecicum HHB10207 ss-3]